MRMIATAMSLAGSGTSHLRNLRKHVAAICPPVSSEEGTDLHECLDKKKLAAVEDNSYSASFHPGASEWLSFWLFLVAGSYFLLSKQVDYFSGCRVKSEEKVSSSNTSMQNERKENDATDVNDMLSCSESSEPSNRSSWMNSWTEVSTECDVYSEISDFDGANYWHSLLSLEEEDSEWLSDSMTYCSSERPSSPLSYNGNSFTEISDVDTPSYWDSLLRLEQSEDSDWISDSKQEPEYVRDGTLIPSYKKSWGTEVLPSVSTFSSFTGEQCGKSEDNNSAEYILETADIEEYFSADEPLFWPFEGEFNWNSDESSFCTSPRRRFVFSDSSSFCKQTEDEALCYVNSETSRLSPWSKSSAITSGCKDDKIVLKHGEVLSNKLLSLNKTFLNDDFDSNMNFPFEREYFALDQEFPIETLVGLKEFDGHEGLDSEFVGDVFMLEESLQ